LSQPLLPDFEKSIVGKSVNTVQLCLYEFYKDSFEIKCETILPSFAAPTVLSVTSPHPSHPSSSGGSSFSSTEGKVSITINGHAHEGKEVRQARIMSMKPVELLKLKFEPLPVDDMSDSEEDDEDPLRPNKHHSKNKDVSSTTKKSSHHSDPRLTIIESSEEEVEAVQSSDSPPKTVVKENVLEVENLYELNFENMEESTTKDKEELEKNHERTESEETINSEKELNDTLYPKPSYYNLLSFSNH
jgi:hypothetical protein